MDKKFLKDLQDLIDTHNYIMDNGGDSVGKYLDNIRKLTDYLFHNSTTFFYSRCRVDPDVIEFVFKNKDNKNDVLVVDINLDPMTDYDYQIVFTLNTYTMDGGELLDPDFNWIIKSENGNPIFTASSGDFEGIKTSPVFIIDVMKTFKDKFTYFLKQYFKMVESGDFSK